MDRPDTIVTIPPCVDDLGIHPVFFALTSEDSNYVKVVLESYDCVGVTRCQDNAYEPERILLVLLLVPDMTAHAEAIFTDLCREVAIEFVPPTEALIESLRQDLLRELDERRNSDRSDRRG